MTEPEPVRGRPLPVAQSIVRVVAPNPSAMTYHGTNTYLVETPDGTVVIDPGPNSDTHIDGVIAAAANRICGILVTHVHHDHVGGAPRLQALTGAKLHGYGHHLPGELQPDVALEDGDLVFGLQALHTPGHAREHICFAHPAGLLFSGDHVMGWSTSTVSPPNGDMTAYLHSLRRLLARDDRIYLPGHGPAVHDPRRLVAAIVSLREARERQLIGALGDEPKTIASLVSLFYRRRHHDLQSAAARMTTAHLLKLQNDGRAVEVGDGWVRTTKRAGGVADDMSHVVDMPLRDGREL